MNRRFGLALLAFALVAADLLRPGLEPGIPLFQATLAAVAVAAVWSVWLSDQRARGERWALLVLVLLTALLYLRHPRSLDADGFHYFSFARSLIFDRDLNLANDYALLGQDPTRTGAGPAPAATTDPDPVPHRFEGQAVVALPGTGHPCQHPAV